MKRSKRAQFIFLAPAVLCFAAMFIYPVFVTMGMSFCRVESLGDRFSSWTFVGLDNFRRLFGTRAFLVSLRNIGGIWVIGGAFSIFFAMLFAVTITSGIKGKSFWKAAVYLPNVISGVAMGTMWVQYVYSSKYGLLKSIGDALGIRALSETQWTSPKHIFLCMVIAFSFGMVGYFMLMLIAGIERIPTAFQEAAMIEGAGVIKRFFSITLPLILDVLKSILTLWTVSVVGFFVWSQMFTPYDMAEGTVTPMVYMYQLVFGSTFGSQKDIGAGAAIGVILSLIVVGVFTLVDLCMKDSDIEF